MKRLVLAVCAVLMVFVLCAAAESEQYGSTEIYVPRNTKYEGTLNPDGNGIFICTTSPRRGELLLNENGRFTYTPKKDFSGKDYFGYRVKDGSGDLSEEKTVIIKISRPHRHEI